MSFQEYADNSTLKCQEYEEIGDVVMNQPLLTNWPGIEAIVSKVLTPVGFEAHPFHVSYTLICMELGSCLYAWCSAHIHTFFFAFQIHWYNELVGPRFYLDYPENTLALVIISGPDTFEKCIIPFIQSQSVKSLEVPKFDPLDGSMKHIFHELHQVICRIYSNSLPF